MYYTFHASCNASVTARGTDESVIYLTCQVTKLSTRAVWG